MTSQKYNSDEFNKKLKVLFSTLMVSVKMVILISTKY